MNNLSFLEAKDAFSAASPHRRVSILIQRAPASEDPASQYPSAPRVFAVFGCAPRRPLLWLCFCSWFHLLSRPQRGGGGQKYTAKPISHMRGWLGRRKGSRKYSYTLYRPANAVQYSDSANVFRGRPKKSTCNNSEYQESHHLPRTLRPPPHLLKI